MTEQESLHVFMVNIIPMAVIFAILIRMLYRDRKFTRKDTAIAAAVSIVLGAVWPITVVVLSAVYLWTLVLAFLPNRNSRDGSGDELDPGDTGECQ